MLTFSLPASWDACFSPPSPQGEGNARYPQGGGGIWGEGWNGQARGKINSFPSDADGLGEVSIYIRPGAGFKSWDGDLRQSAQTCFN